MVLQKMKLGTSETRRRIANLHKLDRTDNPSRESENATSGPSWWVSFMRIWAKGITVFFSSCSLMPLREGSAFICKRLRGSIRKGQRARALS